jgi:ElaB/YqjD/DUF883 family membrane-anchored ribosome-binding protein
MFSKKPTETSNHLVDQAAQSADNAIQSTRRLADDTLDSLAGGVQDLRQQATPMLNRVGEQASALASRGAAAVRDGSQQLRDRAMHASDSTIGYIKDEPVKAMLIAAATGAALMAMLSLLTRSRH